LCAELNQWPTAESAQTQTAATIRQHRTKQKQRKGHQLRSFIFTPAFLKISVDLQTTFAAEMRRAEGQWLEEQLDMVKSRYVPSRNANADSFEDRGPAFSATGDIC
jgi:hypothetical protein